MLLDEPKGRHGHAQNVLRVISYHHLLATFWG